MSDSNNNKKSIMDFVARSQQQFAAKRNNGVTSSSTTLQATSNTTSSSIQQQKSEMILPTSSFYTHNNNNSSSSSTGLVASLRQQQQVAVNNNNNNNNNSLEHKQQLLTGWAEKLENFVNDSSQTKLELPTLLSGADRRELHMLASKFNLSHSSVGIGTQRRLVLTKDALFYEGSVVGVNGSGSGSGAARSGGGGGATTSTTELMVLEQTKSKGQIRRERQEQRANQNEADLYADKKAIKGFKKYSDAVNPMARAVHVGGEDVDDDNNIDADVGQGNNNFNRQEDASEENDRHHHHHDPKRRQRHHEEHQNTNFIEDFVEDLHQDQASGTKNNNNNNNNIFIPESEWLTVEQVEEAASVNEIPDEDITTWIRQFAQDTSTTRQQQGKGSVDDDKTERVSFCIDFADFHTSSAPVARDRKNIGRVAIVILAAQPKKNSGNGGNDDDQDNGEQHEHQEYDTPLQQQFKNLLRKVDKHSNQVSICLPGTPLFGESLKVAVAIPIYNKMDEEVLENSRGEFDDLKFV